MAKISVLKDALMICRLAGVTPFIWGHRGLGKSSLVRQITTDKFFGFVDQRCAQLEASDIRGLPDRNLVDKRTEYLPPAEMPKGDLADETIKSHLLTALGISDSIKADGKPYEIADIYKRAKEETNLQIQYRYTEEFQRLQPRYENGILFLDEVNRAQDDVLQSAFQLVLDKKIGQYVLPPGWSVVAAGNYMQGYLVGGFNDPAFLNRFCHLTLTGGETTIGEWVSFMSENYQGDASEVIEFASQDPKHLDGDIPGELGFAIQPSRRSWEFVVRVLQVCRTHSYSEQAKLEVLAGLIGRELAISFSQYSCPVKPLDLLHHGVAKYETALSKLNRNQQVGLMWGLISYSQKKVDTDEATALVCLDFTNWMLKNSKDKDLVVAFMRTLVSGPDHQDKARAAMVSNAKLANMVAKFNANKGNAGPKSFIDRLVERPELQALLAQAAWGDS